MTRHIVQFSGGIDSWAAAHRVIAEHGTADLVLALAAVHAARPIAPRRLRLDDIDRPSRRITINGRTRPLDEATATLHDRHLAERQRRWPHTLNPHLFLSEQTGHDQRPVSEWWLEKPLRGLASP